MSGRTTRIDRQTKKRFDAINIWCIQRPIVKITRRGYLGGGEVGGRMEVEKVSPAVQTHDRNCHLEELHICTVEAKEIEVAFPTQVL